MSSDDPKRLQTTWSPEILTAFHKLINAPLPINLIILEKRKSTTYLEKNKSTSFGSDRLSHVSYRGIIPISESENINVIINPVARFDIEKYKNYIGYIELVNNPTEDFSIPGIRGFVKEDLGICESFNEMLIESKIFNSKMSPVYVYLEQSYCLKDKLPKELLNQKIPIREISTFHKISCSE